jgi:hypothetical protein
MGSSDRLTDVTLSPFLLPHRPKAHAGELHLVKNISPEPVRYAAAESRASEPAFVAPKMQWWHKRTHTQ